MASTCTLLVTAVICCDTDSLFYNDEYLGPICFWFYYYFISLKSKTKMKRKISTLSFCIEGDEHSQHAIRDFPSPNVPLICKHFYVMGQCRVANIPSTDRKTEARTVRQTESWINHAACFFFFFFIPEQMKAHKQLQADVPPQAPFEHNKHKTASNFLFVL